MSGGKVRWLSDVSNSLKRSVTGHPLNVGVSGRFEGSVVGWSSQGGEVKPAGRGKQLFDVCAASVIL